MNAPAWRRWARRRQLIAVAGMTVIWMLLWGDFTWGNLIGGIVVAVVVLAVFPLPSVHFHGRIRPLRVVIALGYFIRDLVVSSAQVTWAAIRPRHRLRNAVIAVRLRVNSDLNLTLTSEALTLIPGSLIVDARRDSGTLYIHVFDLKNIDDVERFRRSVLALEERLVRAFGSPDEVSQLDAAKASS